MQLAARLKPTFTQMSNNLNVDRKINQIRSFFRAVIGAKLISYETAELLLTDGSWDCWPDLPIRLHTDTNKIIAVSWTRFDDLWIATDSSLPFSVADSTIRWVTNSIEKINAAIGAKICSVMIGRGEMSIEGKDVEIWTRLLIQVDEGWLEIFNALDENGYDFHTQMPKGDFVRCI